LIGFFIIFISLTIYFYFISDPTLAEQKSNLLKISISDSIPDFTCPTKDSLRTLPKSCSQNHPRKYPKTNNYTFFPLWIHKEIGPSEETQGLKHIFMLAAIFGGSLNSDNFTLHFNDKLSEKPGIWNTKNNKDKSVKLNMNRKVPFGLRVDAENFCKFLGLENFDLAESNLDEIFDFSPKSKYKKLSVEEKLKNYIYTNSTANQKFRTVRLRHNFYQQSPSSNSTIKSISKNIKILPINPIFSKIGIAGAENWIFENIYKYIDLGGSYVVRDPWKADGKAPNFNESEIKTSKQLVKDSYLATKHPKFIRDLASVFVEKVMNIRKRDIHERFEPFIGIHFRYNLGDYFRKDFLKKGYFKQPENGALGISSNLTEKIYKVLNGDVEYFLEKVVSFPRSKSNNRTGPQTIYISSPPNISKIFSKIKFYKNFKSFTTNDSKKFLKNVYEDQRHNCSIIKEYFGDILSTFEKEIMIRSSVFYRSRPSNWSFNVQGHRFAEYEHSELVDDEVILHVF